MNQKGLKKVKFKIQVDFELLIIDLVFVDFVNRFVSSVKLIPP